MKKRTVFATGGSNPFKGAKTKNYIQLDQTGRDSFTVTYGLQQHKRLDYATAAARLGEAIMHNATCAGLLDNEDDLTV